LKDVAAQAINKSIIPVTADVTSKESLQVDPGSREAR